MTHKFIFIDNKNISLYENGKVQSFTSKYTERYHRTEEQLHRSKEWKTSGSGAQFLGQVEQNPTHEVFTLSGAYPTEHSEELLYTFESNATSGIYYHNLADEKVEERHAFTTNQGKIHGGDINQSRTKLAFGWEKNGFSNIAILQLQTGDISTVTDGESQDCDPYFANQNTLYFSSQPSIMDANGQFHGFGNAEIIRYELDNLQLQFVLSHANYHYYRPIYKNGELYALRVPNKEKKGSFLLDVLLFPVRILQGIAGFLNIFVRACSGKSMTSNGNNPAKGREYDSREIIIRGNLIRAEQNDKKNGELGLVPKDWTVIRVSDGKELAHGVIDYDVTNEGELVYTTGKKIYYVNQVGEKSVLATCENCQKISLIKDTLSTPTNDLFFD